MKQRLLRNVVPTFKMVMSGTRFALNNSQLFPGSKWSSNPSSFIYAGRYNIFTQKVASVALLILSYLSHCGYVYHL
jgi:hypothetical protein